MSEEATTQEAAPESTEAKTQEEAPLEAAGLKALESERDARRKEKERRVKAEKALADTEARIRAEYEDKDKSDVERLTEAANAAKEEAKAAQAELLRLRIAAEEQVPPDLVEFLSGNDEEELREKAAKLKAATASAGDARRAPAPDPSQGAQPNGTGPTQLTREDLSRMSPADIEKARQEGRFENVLAGRA